MIRVSIADTPELLRQAQRLRYEVFVEELGREPDGVERDARVVADALDETATVLIAMDDSERGVATVRFNRAGTQLTRQIEADDAVHWAGKFNPAHVSLSSKIAVRKEYRHGTALPRMLERFYAALACDGILFDFCDCLPAVLPFFYRVGYRTHSSLVHRAGYGWCQPLVLVVHDYDHLAAVQSPFYRAARNLGLPHPLTEEERELVRRLPRPGPTTA